MVGLRVVHWQRYGNERLYVNDADGRTLGWVDVGTGVKFAEPGHAQDVEKALAAHEQRTVLQVDPVGPLARHRPGQLIQDKALEIRRSHPWRTFFARLFSIHTEERAYRVGASGERRVGRELDRLDRNVWRNLHSIPLGLHDMDHVVIGPPGVFVLNTKHHPAGRIWVGGEAVYVNGQRYRYLRASRRESERVGQTLSSTLGFEVPVQGTVVVVGAWSFTVKTAPPPGIAILEHLDLCDWLERQPARLSPLQVETIYRAATRPETWARLIHVGAQE